MLIDADDKRRAIIVALDPAAPGSAGLELLRDVAIEQSCKLLGLFIEDTELLAHAQSRLATEVMLSGAARPLDFTQLERQLNAQSLAIRRIFEREAARLGLPHAFRTLRGQLVGELAIAAADAEMLVIELAQLATGAPSIWASQLEQLCRTDLPNVLYAREGWTTGSTVLAIIDEAADVETSGRAAASLARAGNSSLTVLLGERSQSHEAEVEAALRRHSRDAVVRVERLRAASLGAHTLAFLAQAGNARALVAPAHLTRSNAGLVRELLRLTRCSIMIARSAPKN
ncbi:MAG: hypothetical protein OEQ25_02680 [Gammaproteobacteria bacterium]|nr:hypothetical protein [Gammaproteobacteria bacterium]MDH3506021.1 hypothetical protein [Gammaproteobacteria bacterium]